MEDAAGTDTPDASLPSADVDMSGGGKPEREEPAQEAPKPKRRRAAKKKEQEGDASSTQPPYIEPPEVNNNFWVNLLATQRAMERAARGTRYSNFAIA